MTRIHVQAGRPYDVEISEKLPANLAEALRELAPKAERLAIISDETVWRLYGDRFSALHPLPLLLEAGEQAKNPQNFIRILESLAAEKFRRSDLLLVLGGGVPGDLGGFAAASYLRGLPFVQLPTTLLSMVDSSVGGKTAIDLAAGKNLAGAFYQPKRVFCCTEFLNSLPAEILRDGLAEVVKYALLGDYALFEHLERYGADFDRETVVSRCIAAKARYVEADEFDRGERKLLNLGHTIAHGIEAESGYTVSHGRAVGMGLGVIARAAVGMGRLEAAVCDRILALLERLGLPAESPYPAETLLPWLTADKKWSAGRVELIVPTAIDRAEAVSVDGAELAVWVKAGCGA